MHICLCRNFNEKTVLRVIGENPELRRPQDIYRACADNREPDCGKCLPKIRDLQKASRQTPA